MFCNSRIDVVTGIFTAYVWLLKWYISDINTQNDTLSYCQYTWLSYHYKLLSSLRAYYCFSLTSSGQPVLIGGTMGTCSYVLTGTQKGENEH